MQLLSSIAVLSTKIYVLIQAMTAVCLHPENLHKLDKLPKMDQMILQRLSSLEELMRRSEGGISMILTRLKDAEVAISTVSKTQSEKLIPEVRFAYEEVATLKRQVATVDQSWRQTYNDFSATITQEIRGRLPQQMDAMQQQSRQDQTAVRHDVGELQQMVRRISDQLAQEAADLRQQAQNTAWKVDQVVQGTINQHKEQMVSLERRVEGLTHELRSFATEVDRNAGGFRQFIEVAVRAAHGDLIQRQEAEARARDALQMDVQTALQKLRDDVIRGLAHSSATSKVLEENTTALETVLRAEVRSRMQKTDELSVKIDRVASTLQHNASSAAQVLQDFDQEMGGAVATTMKETRTQLDLLWDEVNRLKGSSGAGVGSGSPVVLRASSLGTTSVPPPNMDPILSMLDLDPDPVSDDDDSEMIDNTVARLREKVRSKASIRQLKAVKDGLYQSMKQRIDMSFAEMGAKLERDQGVLEQYLQGLRQQLMLLEKNGTTVESEEVVHNVPQGNSHAEGSKGDSPRYQQTTSARRSSPPDPPHVRKSKVSHDSNVLQPI